MYPAINLQINQETNLNVVTPITNFIPTFSTSYSTELHKVQKIVTKYLPILSHDPIYSWILAKGIRTVSRRAPSLSSFLSPSFFSSRNTSTNWLSFQGTFKCGGRSCAYCSFIKGGDTITSMSTGKSYKIHSFSQLQHALHNICHYLYRMLFYTIYW